MSKSTFRQKINQADAAWLLGISDRQFRRLKADGVFPEPEKVGLEYQWWPQDILSAWDAYRADKKNVLPAGSDDGEITEAEAKRRLTIARWENQEIEKQLKAFELEVQKGELIEAKEACEALANIALIIREKMLAAPKRIGPALASLTGYGAVADIEAVVEKVIDEVLVELSEIEGGASE